MLTEDEWIMDKVCKVALSSRYQKCKVGAFIRLQGDSAKEIKYYAGYNQEYPDKSIHAEVNAINYRGGGFEEKQNATAYITKAPCLNCCHLMVERGVKAVICPPPYDLNPSTGQPSKWIDSQRQGIEYLKTNGVQVSFVDIEMREGIPRLKKNIPFRFQKRKKDI